MIISLLSEKGGVGKSTVAICLAVEAMRRGRKVLLADADSQGTTRTWAAVAGELEQVAPPVVAVDERMHEPDRLPAAAQAFDLVFVDGAPRIGRIQRAALVVSDAVVIPSGPSAADAWAVGEIPALIAEAREHNTALKAFVLVNRVREFTTIGRDARSVLEETGIPVLRSTLGDRVAFMEALAAGRGVTTYQPTSVAAVELVALYSEIMRKVR